VSGGLIDVRRKKSLGVVKAGLPGSATLVLKSIAGLLVWMVGSSLPVMTALSNLTTSSGVHCQVDGGPSVGGLPPLLIGLLQQLEM